MKVMTFRAFAIINEIDILDRKSRKRGGKAKYRGISNDQICVFVARGRQKNDFLWRSRTKTGLMVLQRSICNIIRLWFRYLDSKEYE